MIHHNTKFIHNDILSKLQTKKIWNNKDYLTAIELLHCIDKSSNKYHIYKAEIIFRAIIENNQIGKDWYKQETNKLVPIISLI